MPISAIGGDEPLQELEPEETINAKLATKLATKKRKDLANNGQLLAGETDHDSVEAEQTKAAKPAKKSKRKKKPKRQADVEHGSQLRQE